MNTTKTTFNALSVQTTQRCNLACAHCYRGDARLVDMPHEVIDALLDQTAMIHTLNIGGGEPTLAVEALGYLVDGIISRSIPIGFVAATINGKTLSKPFAEQMKRLEKHAKNTGGAIRQGYRSLTGVYPVCSVIISNDEYHDAQGVTKDNKRDAERFYIAHWLHVSYNKKPNMDNLIAAGRAKDGFVGKTMARINRFHRIPSIEEIDVHNAHIEQFEPKSCMEVMPNGSVILDGSTENDYPERHPEGVLCNVLTDSIAEAIEAWNDKYEDDQFDVGIEEFTI